MTVFMTRKTTSCTSDTSGCTLHRRLFVSKFFIMVPDKHAQHWTKRNVIVWYKFKLKSS